MYLMFENLESGNRELKKLLFFIWILFDFEVSYVDFLFWFEEKRNGGRGLFEM